MIPQTKKMKPDGENIVLLQTTKACVEGSTDKKDLLLDWWWHPKKFYAWEVKLPVISRGTFNLQTFGSIVKHNKVRGQGPVSVTSMAETTCMHIQLHEEAQFEK